MAREKDAVPSAVDGGNKTNFLPRESLVARRETYSGSVFFAVHSSPACLTHGIVVINHPTDS